ncbi:glycosyltransferase family 2 protein [Brachybacterium phenoliresistens]|uniref:Glycosyl transferase n=1 Tax=Brachybacterium phenoliresistens TaxID=396014 RepID=Z9JQD3_9MICO|nr:glycosyltransferase family 2 protein [Brachybacterium phenoliresistens]EWS79991.1 glycosyl transferase [Brachybacterium phenoliresistens]
MILDLFIPYWGEPEYLRATVLSVLAQDDPNWRLTVVDDAYPDLSAGQWVQSLDDERITYLRKDSNEGITANYRTCVSLATEPVMVMIGSDDELLPNYVRTIREVHERFPGAAIIQPGVEVIDEHGRIVDPLVDKVKQRIVRPHGGGCQLLSGESLAANLLTGDWLYWPALAFRTDRIRSVDFRDGFPIIQDLALILDMVYRGDQMLVAPQVCFRYRRHSGSASSVKLLDGTRFAGERDYFALAAAQARELGWSRAERAAKARLTSRAHAATLMPGAAMRREWGSVRALARHALGR